MNFSRFFIRRPILATVLALLFVVAGLLSLGVLPVAQYPDITPPTVQVTATYPGANANTVAQTVGIPIEQQVNGVEGMMYMASTSSASGEYRLTVTFEVGTDVDMATVMVQNRVNAALPTLPDAVKQQGVAVTKQSTDILMFLTLTGDSLYDGLYLANYAQLNLSDQLARVPGVGSVQVMGAGNYSMRVWLDPEAMRIRGVTPQEVYQAVAAQNMQVSAGYVGQPVGAGDDNAFQYALAVKGRLETPEEFGRIIIRVEQGERLLRLSDVARIEVGSQTYTTISRVNGQPTAAIAIYQLPGANALEVVEDVRNRMDQLAQALPVGVRYEVALDTTEVVSASIHEVLKTFIEATVLVVLVIFLFLRSWRAVIIPCITIPVSLIGTLAVMHLLGFSLNMLTLFGLVLAIAIVVDDAIVVTENATRLLSTGHYRSAADATTEAMREITGPIIGVVLVMLAVFLPTIFIGGISGELYKQFALTIAASTVISAINSLTLSPALCALLLKEPATSIQKPSEQSESANSLESLKSLGALNSLKSPESLESSESSQPVQEGPLYRSFNRVVGTLLVRPALTAITFLIMAVAAFTLYDRWPSTFIPEEDDGYFMVAVQLPAASSLTRTEAVCSEVEQMLSAYPEVKTCISLAGFNLMGGGTQTNAGTFFVVLKDWKERKGREHHAAAVVERFNAEVYARVQQAQVFAMIPPAIPGLGATGGLQLELEDRRSLGAAEMQKAVQTLMQAWHTEPALAGVSSVFQANVPQYFLEIDRDKVQVMGLTMDAVFQALAYYMGQAYVNDYVQFGRTYQVLLSAGEQSQKQAADVLRLSVTNKDGEVVPFSAFTWLKEQLGMDQITRYNMYDAAALTCNVAAGYSSGQAIEAMERLVGRELGDSFGYEWTSVAYQEQEAQGSTALVFAMALLVAFLVLAAQYESWTSPVAAVMGVPIALLGAILGCWLFGLPVSIYSQIGIVLLIALSAKNGILIVEFARDYRAQGFGIRQSASEAASVRLRPILMTSLSFVFGVMPLLFASGAGAGSELSLGATVVFGMALNTVVATLYIPSWYEWMQTVEERLRGRGKKV
ncbi:MAG: efflux RND transporter permease subunit [Bacteroidaceae bacterium]|nr:efflux RND transporter permease subunit [Bacteroidaceae bacterium]